MKLRDSSKEKEPEEEFFKALIELKSQEMRLSSAPASSQDICKCKIFCAHVEYTIYNYNTQLLNKLTFNVIT